jgi:flagellar basal body rod protein FlgC
MDVSAIALSGLDRAQASFEKAASRIAAAGATTADGTPSDTVDLAAAAVELASARQDFAANIAALKAADEMERRTIDVLG